MGHHRFTLAALLGVLVFGVGGCGFTPLYSSAGYERLGGLDVDVVVMDETGDQRFDYLLQNAIRDFTGPGDSSHRLRIQTRIVEQGAGVSPTGVASRITLTGYTSYSLEEPAPLRDASQAAVSALNRPAPLSGSSQATVGFDRTGDPYAQIAARSAAEERLATRLAEEVMQDLAVGLRRREAGLTP